MEVSELPFGMRYERVSKFPLYLYANSLDHLCSFHRRPRIASHVLLKKLTTSGESHKDNFDRLVINYARLVSY